MYEKNRESLAKNRRKVYDNMGSAWKRVKERDAETYHAEHDARVKHRDELNALGARHRAESVANANKARIERDRYADKPVVPAEMEPRLKREAEALAKRHRQERDAMLERHERDIEAARKADNQARERDRRQ